jgi:fructosamine-3-kinase
MTWKNSVIKSLEKHFSYPVELISVSPVSGGDINEAFRFETSSGDFFVKKNSLSRFPRMFEKEASGLKVLAEANEIPVPVVVATGAEKDEAFLVLRFIQSGAKPHNFWDGFAKNLARLHKHTAGQFGLDHDNYIGSLYQSNRYHKKWTDFFREERLEIQVKLARDNSAIGKETVWAFERFYNKLDEIFPVEPPALLHGDLWGGNFMTNQNGEAVIIDPAVYFGHREMDLAMSQLFGGFDGRFYESYHQHYPLEKGWQKRMDYCNLYPLMVHVNLFGGSYLNSVQSILHRF